MPRKILGFLRVPSFFPSSHSRRSPTADRQPTTVLRASFSGKTNKKKRSFVPWKTFCSLLSQKQYLRRARARLLKSEIARDRVVGWSIVGARGALINLKKKKRRYICERENQSWARNCVASHNQLVSGKTDNFLSTRTHCQSGRFTVKLFLSKFD